MTTLVEIEAAAATLPVEQQRMLFDWLAPRVCQLPVESKKQPSLLDIAPVSLGQPLTVVPDDDDLLGDMLEIDS